MIFSNILARHFSSGKLVCPLFVKSLDYGYLWRRRGGCGWQRQGQRQRRSITNHHWIVEVEMIDAKDRPILHDFLGELLMGTL